MSIWPYAILHRLLWCAVSLYVYVCVCAHAHVCACIYIPLRNFVKGSHVVIGSSWIKASGDYPTPLPPPLLFLWFFFFYRLLRRWAYKLICNPFKHTFRAKVTCGVTVMVSVIPCGSVWECSRDVGEWSRMTSVQPVYWQGADYYTELASPSLQPP